MVKRKQKSDIEELRTPAHDALVLQLLEPENATKLLSLIGYDFDKRNWKFESYGHYYDGEYIFPSYKSRMTEVHLNNVKQIIDDDINNKIKEILNNFKSSLPTLIKYSNIRTEVPIGYNSIWSLDIQIMFALDFIFPIAVDNIRCEVDYIVKSYGCEDLIVKEEHDVSWRGYIHLSHKSALGDLHFKDIRTKKVIVDAKSQILSFGETMRQLNKYREWLNKSLSRTEQVADFVIYSPDERFRSQFENQEIKFVTPTEIGIDFGMENILNVNNPNDSSIDDWL